MAMNNCGTRKGIQPTSISSKEDLVQNDINIKEESPIEPSEHLLEVRNLLKNDLFKTLDMVDCLQKLCIDHHFREEIDSILKMLYTNAGVYKHDQSLYEVSLYFRILRQEGYYVPADVFSFIKKNDGRFKGEIAQDVKGLMALYEASQLSIGERILEEAVKFSSNGLKEMMPILDEDEIITVNNTLEHTYQRTSSTFMVKKFIKHYAGTTMSQLAELELAKVQSLHRREVDKISRWWKDLGLGQELKLARNQPLNWYLWPMASLTDPSLSEQRIELTKPIALIFIIDDIFDVYGTLDELIILTEAVNRWDSNSLDQLPYYQRICIQALYDITHEICDKIYKKYGFNPMEYLKETVGLQWIQPGYAKLESFFVNHIDDIKKKFMLPNFIKKNHVKRILARKYKLKTIEFLQWINLCEAFLVEAKWFSSGHMPMAEDYLKNGIVSSGAQVVIVHMFFLLGGGTNKESASIINDNQGITSCLSKILRLWDDLGSAKDENQDGHDGSYLTYYMKENEDCSIQNAREHVMEMISCTWKQLNKECLFQKQFSATFTKACLNLARMVPIMYNYDENRSLPLLKDYIKSMF